jgi:tetratricopeptide (TPR) repeat protein
MEQFRQLIEDEEYTEAIEGLNGLLSSNPYNTEAITLLAKAQFKLKKFAESIDNYSKLINLLPNIADYYADRGLCHHMAGEYKSALLDFDKAIELEPENAYRYSCRAFVKDYYKDYKGALIDYKKAIELDPEDAIAYNNKGVLEEKLGFADQAKESFDASNQLQGVDLDKELSKINITDLPPITLSEPDQPSKGKVTVKGYLNIIKYVFSSKKGFSEFINFFRPIK